MQKKVKVNEVYFVLNAYCFFFLVGRDNMISIPLISSPFALGFGRTWFMCLIYLQFTLFCSGKLVSRMMLITELSKSHRHPHFCLSLFPLGSGETCGGHLDASDAGYITSPGYPMEYPPHQSCQWVINAPEPTQRIVLNFNPHFELERLDCRWDAGIKVEKGLKNELEKVTRSAHTINLPPTEQARPAPWLELSMRWKRKIAKRVWWR